MAVGTKVDEINACLNELYPGDEHILIIDDILEHFEKQYKNGLAVEKSSGAESFSMGALADSYIERIENEVGGSEDVSDFARNEWAAMITAGVNSRNISNEQLEKYGLALRYYTVYKEPGGIFKREFPFIDTGFYGSDLKKLTK
jgi:hypothetical protein